MSTTDALPFPTTYNSELANLTTSTPTPIRSPPVSPTTQRKLSMSLAPPPTLLPKPYASGSYVVGQLGTPSHFAAPTGSNTTATLRPSVLADRDYDDTTSMPFYKDVLALNEDGFFTESLGGQLLVPKPADGTRLVCLEATRLNVRALKNADEAFAKVLRQDEGARAWIEDRLAAGEPVLFVTRVAEALNASFKLAGFRDAEGEAGREGLVEVLRPGEEGEQEIRLRSKGPGGKMRRDSGFEQPTGSRSDVVGVEVRRVRKDESGRLELGDLLEQGELGALWEGL